MSTNESPGAEVAALRGQVERLTVRVAQLERELASTAPLVAAVRNARFWDFTPYETCPDPGWVAVDRDTAVELLRSLAETDHWRPWQTTLERRSPQ